MAGRCNSKMPVNFLRHAIGGDKAAARPVKTFSVGAVGAVTRLQSESTPISSSAFYSVVDTRVLSRSKDQDSRAAEDSGAVSLELSILPCCHDSSDREAGQVTRQARGKRM